MVVGVFVAGSGVGGVAAAGGQAQAEHQSHSECKKLLHGMGSSLNNEVDYLRRLSILVDSQLNRDWMTWTRTMMKITVASIIEGTLRW